LLLTSSALTLLAGQAALAQDAAPALPTASDVVAPSQVNEIVVTGSRLSGGFSAPTPVTVVGGPQLEQRAATVIGEVLNELPAFRQTTSPTQLQRAPTGAQSVADLRGLGVQRTLTLVNGRRFVPTNPNGTIDLSLLPTSLVERVEVVTGGASAAYGSDAVAGVVNVILADRLEGVRGNVQYGVSSRGDGKEPSASLAGGFSFGGGRGHVVVGGDYADNKGVGNIDSREWAKNPGVVAFGANRTPGLPAQGYVTDVTFAAQAPGGVINSPNALRGITFDANGQPYPFQYGQVYSNLMIGGANPGGNPSGSWPLVMPHRRYTALALANYEITPDLTVFAEGSYGRNDMDGFTSYPQTASLTILRDNPFLPASLRNQMIAANIPSFTMGRLHTEYGGTPVQAYSETTRFVGGLKGRIFGDWRWDAYYQTGQTSGHNRRTATVTANVAAASYAVMGPNGTPVCGPLASNPNLTAATIAQVQPGCVPIDLFGPGRPSQAALDYVAGRYDTAVGYHQDVAALNLSGEPFSTWAGPVQLAVGAEYRRERVSSLADPLSQIGAFAASNGSTYAGRVSVKEGYAEIGVPLARDLGWAKALDLNGAVRRTDYSTSGAVTTWKLGLTYEPNDALRLRATRSRDIRAPSLLELYNAGGSSVLTNFANLLNGQTGFLRTISGGNTGLVPEIADTFTAGLVFQPTWSWASGLRASVDYYKIKVDGVITTPVPADIVRECRNGDQRYCGLIALDSTPFGIASIRLAPLNLNKLVTSGLDFELSYRVPIDHLNLPGRLDVRGLATWVDDLTTTDLTGSIDRAGAGAGGVPEWTANVTMTYALSRFSTSVQARYTSPIKADATLIGPNDPRYDPKLPNSVNRNLFPASLYWNLSAQYDLITGDKRRLQIFGLVNNLFDKDPPTASRPAIESGNPYDVIGRYFKAGLRFAF
jgi:outer membrane receptor protein involved in Fe transport